MTNRRNFLSLLAAALTARFNPSPAHFSERALTADDLSFINARQFAVDEIARVYRVPRRFGLSNLPVTPNGGDIVVRWSKADAGIWKL